MKTVLITGGSGRLAQLLASSFIPTGVGVSCIRHSDLDVTKPADCVRWGKHYDIVINCAAVMTMESEADPAKAVAVNATGVANLIATLSPEQRFVQISTDYVFSGRPPVRHDERSDYKESAVTAPGTVYGMTKLLGERIALSRSNSLVLRAPFRYGPPWPYDNAYCNQWTSARWIREAAVDIALAALEYPHSGVLHIGGPRLSIYQLATSIAPDITKSYRSSCPVALPLDTSLDSSRWLAWLEDRKEAQLCASR